MKEVDTNAKTVGDLLKELNYNTDEYFVAINGKVVTEDYPITEDMEIVLVPVVSGG